MDEIFYAPIPAEALRPAEEEIAARLRIPMGYRDAQIDALEKELKGSLRVGMAAIRVPFLLRENTFAFPTFSVESAALAKCLSGCREAYLLAVTLGMQNERWLHRLSILSTAKHFLADALSSAYAEAAADYANALLAKENTLTNRFSPGYGDLSLSLQPHLISATNANKLLHITLTDSLLMVPQKSITAIIGIRSEDHKGEIL
jgi:hypothetical protein